MILGIGMDIVEVLRFGEAVERRGNRLRQRFFTKSELAYCDGRPDAILHLAARFAAKEAFSKALGSGIARGIRWVDVEVVREENGRPGLVLHARAQELADDMGVRRMWLTLTHTPNTAAATVVLEG